MELKVCKTIELRLVKTSEQLPPENHDKWILGFGEKISGNIYGKHSLMYYDGNWWNEDGTEMTDHAPEYWAYLPDSV